MVLVLWAVGVLVRASGVGERGDAMRNALVPLIRGASCPFSGIYRLWAESPGYLLVMCV